MNAALPVADAAYDAALREGRVRVGYEGDHALPAGSLARFDLVVAADFALPPGAEVGLARRWPSDWGTPQASDPAGADYVDVAAAPGRALRWWNARLHPWHPFDHVLFVALPEGLAAGERLRVRFGAADGGSPGFTVQTFIEEASPLAVRMRLGPDAEWTELARPTVRIDGNVAHAIVLTAPSRVARGEAFSLQLRAEDEWGNPARLDCAISIPAIGRDVVLPQEGWTRIDVALDAPGIHRLDAFVAGRPGMAATSNPIEVVDGPVGNLLCWGDLHAQSVIGCGARSIDAYFRHARDFAATDFGSHQANCFLVSSPEWRETEASTARIHEDGRFVALLGVEWSGASSVGGDHNLYFPGDTADLRRCSHEFVADKSDLATDLPHVTDVYDHYRDTDTLVAVHVGGRTADLRWHEPSLDRLLEVHSTHATSEWFLLDALKRGYRMGVVAGSDSVDGRPGGSHPGHMGVRNVRGGLTAVSLPARTRSALWTALKARHCYGTTGPRIIVRLSAGAAQMGDEIAVAQLPAFDALVEGTAPLERIDFFRDDTLLASRDLMAEAAGGADALSNTIRVGWCGTTSPGNWQRARMQWDGELRIAGARIARVEPWAFDTPDEGIRERGEQRVRWRSITAGDWDGVLVTLDDCGNAEATFVSGPLTLRTRLSDLDARPRTFDAANPARKVELRRLPRALPALGWRGTFSDPAPDTGRSHHAYWLRVRQADGAYAWSSPIFVTLTAGAGQ
jgi:hypothetical protein